MISFRYDNHLYLILSTLVRKTNGLQSWLKTIFNSIEQALISNIKMLKFDDTNTKTLLKASFSFSKASYSLNLTKFLFL